MSRPVKMSEDEKTLLNCSDSDIAVVSRIDCQTEDNELEDESLESAMSQGKPIIAIKHPDLARDVAFWLKIGQCYRQASLVSAGGACACAALDSVRPSKILAIASAILGAVYCSAWHWDPIYDQYHLLENLRLLTLLGSRYRRGTNVVLIRNRRRSGFWIPVATPIFALCFAYGCPVIFH